MAEESHTPVSEDDLFPGATTVSTSQFVARNHPHAGMTSSPPTSQDPGSQALLDAPRAAFIPSSPSISKLPDGRLVHEPSGYTWSREEDAPGYSWMSKRATEDYHRAMESIVDRERGIGTKYGDIGLKEEGGSNSQSKK